MNITIFPGKLRGSIRIIPSKSQAHRLLICAAFADAPTTLLCPETNRDIEATVRCLCAIGANILKTDSGYHILPIAKIPGRASLFCGESGSTLRFLLPVVGALGIDTTFHMEGRLPSRPLSPLWEEMERMGCCLSRPTNSTLRCQGRLHPGEYTIAGNISSQYITGLLFALSLPEGTSRIRIQGALESAPYVAMTRNAMSRFGICTDDFRICGGKPYHSPGTVEVEGDWSNGAFFLAANAMGSNISLSNLSPDSPQGDRIVLDLLDQFQHTPTIHASDIPDLVPVLSVVAAAGKGATFTGIQRLRLKESDRVASVISMLEALGGKAEATADTLTVYGTGLTGGTVDAVNDHRIAMSAAIAATVCSAPVTILGAECVEKSYPRFFEELKRLGGKYEFNIR